jgi:hypothetical protein
LQILVLRIGEQHACRVGLDEVFERRDRHAVRRAHHGASGWAVEVECSDAEPSTAGKNSEDFAVGIAAAARSNFDDGHGERALERLYASISAAIDDGEVTEVRHVGILWPLHPEDDFGRVGLWRSGRCVATNGRFFDGAIALQVFRVDGFVSTNVLIVAATEQNRIKIKHTAPSFIKTTPNNQKQKQHGRLQLDGAQHIVADAALTGIT